MGCPASFHFISQQFRDQFLNSRPMTGTGNVMDMLFQGRQSVSHSGRQATELKESLIILGIPHAGNLRWRPLQSGKRGEQAGGLVDMWGQDHECAFIRDKMKSQSEFLNGLLNDPTVGLLRRNNGAADGEGMNSSFAQALRKSHRWGR